MGGAGAAPGGEGVAGVLEVGGELVTAAPLAAAAAWGPAAAGVAWAAPGAAAGAASSSGVAGAAAGGVTGAGFPKISCMIGSL